MQFERITGFPQAGQCGLFWLGQAGFWLDTGQHRVLIDPYLSDSLATKYRGKKHPHIRMMPAPIDVMDLPKPDIVLVTHAHTDHMDPDTLGPLHQRFADVPFVVPAAAKATAQERIGADARLILADAGQVLNPLTGLWVHVFAAAHEDFNLDEQGRHPFLGYGIATQDLRVYHSGDTIPFAGLKDAIAALEPDVLLLPVNGRDAARLSDGVPGNLTLAEAMEIAAPYPMLVPHHFGMFDFNTLDPQAIDAAAKASQDVLIVRPRAGEHLGLSKP